MGLARALSAFVKKRSESPWEVVDSKDVEPVPVWDDEDDLDIVFIHETAISRTYIFDVSRDKDFKNAVVFAQQKMLEEVNDKGYNVLWCEGWRATLLRKGKRHRVEVRYKGRPARLSGKPLVSQLPPFMGVLDEMRYSTHFTP
ncbi:uncharacterized protein STEHIDRAFT_152064 [Stereum hirsutum FP-91666 SS1]|uniref:uncharacterized protein n=1 Tax=Stereum hirsutum (strain FP-91666) TaxID=721885 RepID=UPI000440B7FB|nr:uncharacterized protein STEHIDRAFT_152064 [Stereum hirsutum FP-91666 SS1]EIM92752.1 hypothetical protein STEHIDRAFT_152064 [Stereum hirsutum FP-91666 SS1]